MQPGASSNPSPLAGEGQVAKRPGRGGETLLDRAKSMRKCPTEAEQRLWSILRNHRLAGFKFKRQQVIGNYIVDFVNFERRLIVEADGSQHAESTYDIARDGWLRSQGFNLIRLWNNDIRGQTAAVADAIWGALQVAPPPLPAASRRSLSRKGRGESGG